MFLYANDSLEFELIVFQLSDLESIQIEFR